MRSVDISILYYLIYPRIGSLHALFAHLLWYLKNQYVNVHISRNVQFFTFLKRSVLLDLEFWLNIYYTNEQPVRQLLVNGCIKLCKNFILGIYTKDIHSWDSRQFCTGFWYSDNTGYGIQITVKACWHLVYF